MNSIIIVTIVFGSIVILAGLLCSTVLVFAKMRRSGLSSSAREANNDEAMMIQEIYQGLERMEKRIEALETILMDSQKKYGEKQ